MVEAATLELMAEPRCVDCISFLPDPLTNQGLGCGFGSCKNPESDLHDKNILFRYSCSEFNPKSIKNIQHKELTHG